MRIYMQTQQTPDQPLRFYQIQLQPDLLGGWTLTWESGIQGTKGKVTHRFFEEREEAERRFIRLRDSQVKRGYQVVYRTGIHADPEE